MEKAWTSTEAKQTNQIDLIAKGLGNGSVYRGLQQHGSAA